MAERVQLSLADVGSLDDGKIHLMFAAELKRCIQDCLNRPGEEKPRKVNLIMELAPIQDEDLGDCRSLKMATDVKSTLPPRRTKQYELGVTKTGQAFFTVEEEDEFDPVVED